MPPPAERPFLSPARLFFLALMVRVAASLATLQAGVGDDFPDTREYLLMARRIAAGEEWSVGSGAPASRPPLYPLFLAAHLKLFGGAAAALATQAALGAAACVWIARTGARLWSPRAGALAGLAAAVYPFLVFASLRFLSEAVYLPLVCAQLASSVEAGRAAFERAGGRAAGWAVATGALGGLAALAHPGHLLFPFALLAAFAFAWWRARQLTNPGGITILVAGAALLLASHALVIAPWTVRNRLVLGGFVPVTTKLGSDLYEATFPGATGGPVEWWDHPEGRGMHERTARLGELPRDQRLRRQALLYVVEEPGRMLRLALVKVWRTWTPVPSYAGFRTAGHIALSLLTYGPVLVLAVMGLARLRRGSILAVLLLAIPVYVTLLHAVFIGSIRYRIPAEPTLLLLAAYRMTDGKRS